MADRKNESLDIEEGSVYDRKRRRVKRANLVLLILAVVAAVIAVSFSAYFMATSGLRQSAGSSDRNMDDGTTARDEVDAGWAGEYSDGLYFDLNSKGTEYEVISSDCEYSEIVIPAEYEGLPVTSIADGAFSGCTSLKSVTIGENVTKIGDSAFYNCTALTEIHYNAVRADDLTGFYNRTFYNAGQSGKGIAVTIGADVERIPAYLFYPFYDYSNFPKTLSVEFEKGSVCESIGRLAFAYNTSLTSADIPGSVVEIESEVFYGCTSLIDLTIAEGVETIGTHAFAGCTSLADVTIPDSVESIRNYAFNECSSLERITIGAGVTDFGYDVFYECTSLCDVTIMEGVTCIGDMAFSRCTSLSEITIPGSVESIGGSAFYNCTALSSIEILAGVESIGGSAFYGCTSLSDVTIPDSVVYIGRSAFSECTSLVEIVIPGSVTSLGNSVFSGCTALKSAVISDGVVDMGSSAFYGCIALESIVIPDSVTSIGDSAFCNCTSLTSVTIPSNITSIGSNLFYNCTSLSDVTIPNSVKSIESSAFYNCTSLESIVIPDSVTSIENGVFSGCGSLRSMTLPFVGGKANATSSSSSTLFGYIFGTTSYIGGSAVTQYYSSSDSATYYIPAALTTVTITGGHIYYGSFYGCEFLKSVTVGKDVTGIESYAFYNCKGLEKIDYDALYIDDLESNNRIFYNAGQDGDGIAVTVGSDSTRIPAYLFYSTSNSSHFPCVTNVIFESDGKCESIGAYAFAYCTSLKDIVIPDSVTSIESFAFFGCSGLESMTLPFVGGSASTTSASESTLFGYIFGTDSFTGGLSIGQYYSSSNYVTYCIPGNMMNVVVTGGQIFYGAFYNCASLISITINNDVTSIGSFAFYGCSNLESMTLPFVGGSTSASSASESTLFGYIFGTDSYTGGVRTRQYYSRSSYVTYYIPSGLTNLTVTGGQIFYGAFYNCTSLTNVTIGDSVTSIGSFAFYGCGNLESMILPFVGGNANATDASSSTLFGYIFGASSYNNSTAVMQQYASSSYVTYYIPNGLTTVTITGGSILYGAFYNCASLINVTIGDGVTEIGSHAFYKCTSLTNVAISDNVTSISGHAFAYCESLVSVVIPDSVVSVGACAFYECSSLESVTIGESVTSIGEWAFIYCWALKEINFNAIHIDDLSMSSVSNIFFEAGKKGDGITVTIGKNVEVIPSGLFFHGGSDSTIYSSSTPYVTTVIFEDGSVCEAIGDYAFQTCTALIDVTIGENVKSIGYHAFYRCSSLTTIVIPKSVTSIGDDAFYACSSLTFVFYTGTAEEWGQIDIGDYNSSLKEATIYYYSESVPTDDGNWWHYVDGEPVIW